MERLNVSGVARISQWGGGGGGWWGSGAKPPAAGSWGEKPPAAGFKGFWAGSWAPSAGQFLQYFNKFWPK